MSPRVLVVVAGPTAVGKTSVAIQLAEHFSSEIVSADSRQIFRELQVGTAKPSVAERGRVRHHFIDSHSIHEDYDAARYGQEALALIHTLFKSREVVILCGGSGLYIRSVCDGFDEIPAVPESLRSEINAQYRAQGIRWLQDRMNALDPEALKGMDEHNPHRLIRALEVRMHTGKSIAAFRQNVKKQHPFKIVRIGLELPRDELNARIEARMEAMIAEGLFEEAKDLYPMRGHNALQTVGYQEIFDYMDGAYDRAECVRLLKRNSRRYAKRQLTWFRKDKDFTWFHPADLAGLTAHIERAKSEET